VPEYHAAAAEPMSPRAKVEAPPRALTPEEQAYKEASDIAARRVRFFGHVVIWAMLVLFLLVTGGFEAALIVGLIWGTFLAHKGYHLILAPELEKRWIEQELLHRREKRMLEDKTVDRRTSRSLEELSASIAHEIRNPITAAKSLLQQIGEDPASNENVEYAKVALEELDRVERSISHLLRYAREEAIELSEVRLSDVVDSALESFRDRLAKSGVRVVRDEDDPGSIRGDAEKLRRVVINLVGNAIDALEEGPTPEPELRISAGHNLAGTEVWLKIRDNGPGIEPERLEKIWSPFHTSKSKGTGLGLAICKKLVEGHRGTIEVTSERGMCTEFTLTFPRPEAPRGER
jgi:signal transduction histidine kinase